MRHYVIAGNWKMNKNPAEAAALIAEIKPLVADASCGVIVGVPFVDLPAALEAVRGTNIGVAAQNCHWEKSGAYTGEVSAEMLASMGVGTVILGHSERRTYFGETDVTVQKRVRAALDAGLTVILCVGETLEQREQGVTGEVVALQTKIALQGVAKDELARVIIAYEPVWAIGTGRTATADCVAVQLGLRRRRGDPVWRLHERGQRRGAARAARRLRRTHRRRVSEAGRFRRHCQSRLRGREISS